MFDGNAAAVLFPNWWPEPFGRLMIEPLACRTPVLALRQGSVPEVMESGLTGWVVATQEKLVAAVDRLGDFDRTLCRIDAEERFSPH